MALLSLRNVSLAFGGSPILDGVSLQVEPGDRLCLMGRNGAGKSTLLHVVNGDRRPDGGEILMAPGTRTALVAQQTPPGLTGSVFDVVAAGMGQAAGLLTEYHHVSQELSRQPDERLLARLAAVQKALEDSGGWSLHQQTEKVISRLELDSDAEFAGLSGGTRKRVLLARALVGDPELLLLDEPTNQLDLETIEWLESFLLRSAPTVLFITHDRVFARRIANRVAELDRGRLYSFTCGYDEFVRRRESLLESEITRLAQLDRKLAQEEAWLRQGIKARRTRNEGRVRALAALREERRRQRERAGHVRMQLGEVERSASLVAACEDVSFAYPAGPAEDAAPDRRTVIRGLTTTIVRGDKVGIIGRNGSGKTTLLRLLLGELEPSTGRIRRGQRLGILHFDQLREELDLSRTVQENVCESGDTVIVGGRARHIIGYLADFLFTPDQARTPVGALSGGERSRVLLARLFTRPCNVLAMDEPTNDLDAETLELLEDLILEYTGTLLLVSHDREFLNNAVTSTLAIQADGTVRESVGGYDDWVRQLERESAARGRPSSAEGAVAPGSRAGSSSARSDVVGFSPSNASNGSQASSGSDVSGAGSRVSTTPARRKLSYKEDRELRALPEKIAALEEEQARAHKILADPAVYREGGARVAELNARLIELTKEIEAAYGRWQELEDLIRPS